MENNLQIQKRENLIQSKERNYSIDILKFLASIAVVAVHVESNYRFLEFTQGTLLWDVSILINIFSKWAVPIFFMSSGYFLLNTRNFEYKEFIKKRFSKVLIPFIVMSFLFTIHYQHLSGNVSLKWGIIGLIKNLLGYPASAHLWFLYPILAIYILIPVFKGILDKLDSKLMLTIILSCFLVKTIIPFTDIIASGQTNYWREIPLITNAATLYFILGGYLGRVNLSKNFKLGLYLATIAIMILSVFSVYKVEFLYNRNLEVLFDISSINNLLLSVTLFTLFKDIKFKKLSSSKIFTRIMKVLSDVNFGIFLLHPIFIDFTKSIFSKGNILVELVNQTIMVYTLTFTTVYIIKKIPILKRIV